MVFKRVVALLVVLAVLVVPVAAYDYSKLYDEQIYGDVAFTYDKGTDGAFSGFISFEYLQFYNIENCRNMRLITFSAPTGDRISVPAKPYSAAVKFRHGTATGPVVGSGTYGSYRADGVSYIWITFDEWDVSAYTGNNLIYLTGASLGSYKRYTRSYSSNWEGDLLHKVHPGKRYYNERPCWSVGVYYTDHFRQYYTLDESLGVYTLDVTKVFDTSYSSAYEVISGSSVIMDGTVFTDDDFVVTWSGDPPVHVNVCTASGSWFNESYYVPAAPVAHPCTINVYDADTRLPLSGDWDYYVVVRGADSVSGSASGASAEIDLPVTSILQPHLLRVTKEGYEQTAPLAFDVPVGGREVNVYLTPSETTAPEGSSVVTFVVTDIETGTPRGQCLVNVDGVGKYAGASGSVWFVLPDNTTHQWLVTAEGYWPIGGEFTLGVDDLVIPVGMTKKTSELPRPPIPGIPGLPVIHPSLDPAGFRMQILSVPILGDLASPLLDTVDSLGVGLDDIAIAVLDVMTAPADQITGAVSSVSQNLIDTATPYLVTSSLLLQVIGAAVLCIPSQVIGLVTFGLLLDIVRILLWGPA